MLRRTGNQEIDRITERVEKRLKERKEKAKSLLSPAEKPDETNKGLEAIFGGPKGLARARREAEINARKDGNLD